MKKLSLLLIVLCSYSSFAQFENYPITDVGFISIISIQGLENAVTVPDGKVWLIKSGFELRIVDRDGEYKAFYKSVGTVNTNFNSVQNIYIPSGYSFYSTYSTDPTVVSTNYIEYDLSQQLSHVEPELEKPTLFPNPTNSMLSLNSDKNYKIQVFDLNGRNLMEQNGNSLNMEHLSNATYVVKAMDVDTKEMLSYKVVKE